jgi:hypothetical protein
VRRIVFDSPTTVDTDPIENALIDSAADEVKLRGYAEGYATHAGSAFDEAWEWVLAVRKVVDVDG